MVARNVISTTRFLSSFVVAEDYDVLTVIILPQDCLLVVGTKLGVKLAIRFRVIFAWLITSRNLSRKCALGIVHLVVLQGLGTMLYIHYI